VATTGISGLPVAFIAVGGILVWSGVENKPVTDIFRTLSTGKAPGKGPGETFATAASSTTTQSGGASSGDTSAHNAGAAANQAKARIQAAPYGWSTGQQWADLVSLWNGESGWSNIAQNPGSTAYGIAQFLDTTWATVGGTKTSDPALQIRYGLMYIKQRYGSPSAAWAAWNSRSPHWY
jgi:hypothetical protein